MRPAILFWFLAFSLAAQTGSVEGTVLNHTNGQPLTGVHITLVTGEMMLGGGADRAYGAITDRAGHFSIADIQPGGYLLIVQRPGFVQSRATGGVPRALFAVKAGQHITDYKLEMTPRALIAGRVVDEYGDPVQNANVQILGASSDSQPVAGFGQSMFGSTDDRGEFRFITGPGRYYLQVQPRNFTQDRTPEIRTDGSSAAPYSTTFYPGTANKTQASVVEVGPGQDVTALEIRLTRSTETTRYLNISGIVTGVPEGERATVSLRSGESADALYNGNTSSAGQDGKFSFPNLEPKYYRLVAQYSSGKVHLQSQSVDFHLTSADAAGVQLVLAPGEDLTGSLEVTGVPAGAAAPKLSVHLDPADNYPSGNSQLTAAPAKDGSFRIGDVFPARYRVRVEPLPESAYIKSIALEGVPVEKDTVDLAHGVKGSRLKIAVALNGGQLSGKVLNHEGEPLVSPLAMLMVWKDAAQVEGDSHPISGGRYNLKGLRPGVYRILAVDVTELFDTLAPSNDEAAQKEMEKLLKAAAEEIEIKDGDQIVKDLRVVDKEKLDGKPKQ